MGAGIRVAELFAGIGGVAGGFIDAGGFTPAFLQDADPKARDVFCHNFPDHEDAYKAGHVQRLSGRELAKLAGGPVDGLLGCPPCQGLSPAGTRDSDDERNLLLLDFARLLREARPRFFLMENVPHLLNTDVYSTFARSTARDYLTHAEVVNAAEYGVPQLRRRAVVLGFRRDLGVQPSLPNPTHGGMGRVFDYATGNFVRPYSQTGRLSLGLRPGVTLPRRPLTSLENAIGDLASNVPNGRKRATTSFQRGMIRGTRRASDHDAWRHSANMVARMLATPAGDCPAEGGGRGRNERYFSQAYARLHARGLARTITTNFHNPGSGRFTHYSEPRTLTLREALRIQSFPDDFSFEGIARVFKSDAERMIGNAFPRLLACQLARHVRTLLA